MFIHTVLWNIQEGKTKEDFKKVQEMMYGLKDLIPELNEVHFAYNENKGDESTRQITLITIFDNEANYIVYRDHKDHLKVKEELVNLVCDRISSDVEI